MKHAAFLVAFCLVGVHAFAQECEPKWSDVFAGGAFAGGDVRAIAQGEVGGEASIFVTGHFTQAEGVPAHRIARLDGERWHAVGAGLDPADPGAAIGGYALAIFDDGEGPALYVGGLFESVDGVPASNIARWDGERWSAVGPGTNGTVRALTVFDDGSGPALYIGGLFTQAGGEPMRGLARYRNGQWSSIGDVETVLNQVGVYCFTTFDDGSGEALYIGGNFTTVDQVTSRLVARWDGTGWSNVGFTQFLGTVLALSYYDDGGGPLLYAAGSINPERLFRRETGDWVPVGLFAAGQFASSLVAVQEPTGPALYIGGYLGTWGSIYRFDGARMESRGMLGGIRALDIVNWGSDEVLVAGGRPSVTEEPGGLVRWVDGRWERFTPIRALPPGLSRADTVRWHDDGSGGALYIGGSFDRVGPVTAQSLARWRDGAWEGIGTHSLPSQSEVLALEPFDDGNGVHMYIGGNFIVETSAGVARMLARWDGQHLEPVDPFGANLSVSALRALKVANTQKLYIGGRFQTIGSVSSPGAVVYDGHEIKPLGGGFSNSALLSHDVRDFAIFDDGTGAALYATGLFDTADGAAAGAIARWDGVRWHPLGLGLEQSGMVSAAGSALLVHDFGSGDRLYVGGLFDAAGGEPAFNMAAWDGQEWSAVPEVPFVQVNALESAPADFLSSILVGGRRAFGQGGHVAAWDGESWSWVTGDGCIGETLAITIARQPGEREVLYIGGRFGCAGNVSAGGVGFLMGCPKCYANCDNSTVAPVLTVDDFTCFIDQFSHASTLPTSQQVDHYANCDGSTIEPVLTVDDFTCFINAFAAGCP